MISYRYKAITPSGQLVRGTLKAPNMGQLETLLQSQEKEMISARKVTAFTFLSPPPSMNQIIEFCLQLQSLLKSKIPLKESLESIYEELPSSRLKQALEDIIMGISSGKSFSTCLQDHPTLFDMVFQTFISVGETTGTLPTTLSTLVDHLKWQEKLKAQTKKSLTYPFFLLGVVVGACGVLLTTLVPQLETFMGTLGTEIPFVSRLLIQCSNGAKEWWLESVLGIIIFGALLKIGTKTSHGVRIRFAKLSLSVPIMGSLYTSILLARYFHVLSHMVSAHLDLLKSLDIASQVITNSFLKERLESVTDSVKRGRSLFATLDEIEILPPLIHRMIKTGEQSGALGDALKDINYFLERELDRRTDHFIKILEPSLLVIMGCLIGWIALAVFYPLYDTLSYMDF